MSAASEELRTFQLAVARAARIIDWQPSSLHLHAIAASIASGHVSSSRELARLVATTVPRTNFDLREGLDTSDLNTLLILARKLNTDVGG